MVTATPAIENAARDLFAQLNIYKNLKFYPSNLTTNIADQYGVSSSQVLVNKFKNLYDFSVQDFYKKNNLVGLDPKYSKALADYLSLPKDEKKYIPNRCHFSLGTHIHTAVQKIVCEKKTIKEVLDG